MARRGTKRNRVLLAAAAAVFLLLLGVETVTLRAWVESRNATAELSDRMLDVAGLANVQREVAKLAFMTDNLDETVTDEELTTQRGLLENQLRRLESGWSDPRPEGADALREGLADFDAWLDRVRTGAVPPMPTVEILELVEDLEVTVKQLYDSAETPYFGAVDQALADRNRSNGLLLITTGLLGAFALVAVLAARQSAKAQRDEAFDTLAARELQHRSVLDSVKDVIFTTDAEGRWTYLSAAWEKLTGFSTSESTGRSFLEFVHPDDRDGCPAEFAALFERGEETRHEIRYVRADGVSVWVEVWAAPDPDTPGTFGTLVDITSRRRFEAELHHQASHDSLTGLPNRELLAEHLGDVVERSTDAERVAGILFLDLDRFKLVNDGLGHDVGDLVLQQVARRISDVLRPGQLVARLGGDEFVIVAEDLGGDSAGAIAAARRLSNQVEAAVSEAVVVGNDRATITASVGITVSRPGARADELIAEADAAMYRAKEHGKAGHEVFDEGLRAAADQRLHLEHALRGARSGQQLALLHQPIVELATGDLVGTEALLRWRHPTRGVIGPDEFLAVAEEAGVMIDIGDWVMRTACDDIAWLRRQPGIDDDVSVSVNLSVRELCSPSLLSLVRDALDFAGLTPDALCVEVTEHDVIDARTDALDNLLLLREMGVRVAMDDFGTGYSSLAYLRRLPVDELKIDRTFVEALTADPGTPGDIAIVQAVADIAGTMGLTTIAEGVETGEQLSRLQELGIHRVQGHFVSPPLARDVLADSRVALPVSSGRGRA